VIARGRAECSPRAQTRSYPEGEDCCEGDGRYEVCGELVVPGGNAAEILEPTEGVLDQVAVAIAGAVVADRAFAAGASGDHRHGAGLTNGSAQRIGVISLVGQDIAGFAGTLEQPRSDGYVGDVPRRQGQCEGPADGVGESMDLGRLTAARGADRLRFRPPFPPKAERCALM
jgi:hypothetical protein